MPTLSLSVSQQHLLHDFVVGEPELPADATRALARLLENVMESVNVRQLDCVSPEEVRELLRATFEVMKVRHLYENGFLSDGQFRSRLESAREQVASYH